MNDENEKVQQSPGREASDMSSLLPCPFCGGDAELDTMQPYRQFTNGLIGSQVAIYCIGEDSCPAHVGICREDVPEATVEQLVKEVTRLWNRRAR